MIDPTRLDAEYEIEDDEPIETSPTWEAALIAVYGPDIEAWRGLTPPF